MLKFCEFYEFKQLKQQFVAALNKEAAGISENRWVSDVFSVIIPDRQSEKEIYMHLNCYGASFPIKAGKSAEGNATRLINFINKSKVYLENIKKSYETLSLKISADKKTVQEKGNYDSRIQNLQKEYNKLFAKIYANTEKN